ncbi:DDE-type integrase/transposase/recombinase [Variovorax sp. W2I14]|uniref:DDE-type integrase/transposase/recombinase n=1 Tax=Variovorax sp. W2I14 TaxID=3042290 RepID=UPI003D1B2E11
MALGSSRAGALFAPPTVTTTPIFPNLYRNVIPSRPDLVWVANFTYIRIETGFCYLAILDACSRKVVGYAISRRIDTPLALAALVRPSEADSRGRAASITRIAVVSMQARRTDAHCRRPGSEAP